jgi:anti-sigma28 factor (negative regulator of flagellin synthesis)
MVTHGVIDIQPYLPAASRYERVAVGARPALTAVPALARDDALRDRVELSGRNEAHHAPLSADLSSRLERHGAIRAAIQSGTYETPERIDRLVDRLLDVIA